MNEYKIPESVLVVIYTKDLNVLLIERTDNPGFWQSVTGSRASLEEPVTETAIREVYEETGIQIVERAVKQGGYEVPRTQLHDWQLINCYEIYPSWRYRYAPGITTNTEHVFGLCVPGDVVINLRPEEHLHYVWLPYQEAADKCFSSSNAEAIMQLPRRI